MGRAVKYRCRRPPHHPCVRVTTPLGRVRNAFGLQLWMENYGRQAVCDLVLDWLESVKHADPAAALKLLPGVLADAPKTCAKTHGVMRRAADVGTVIHAAHYLEADPEKHSLWGRLSPAQRGDVMVGLKALEEIVPPVGTVIHNERAFIDDELRLGGTVDRVWGDGEDILIEDLKGGANWYPEYAYQVAAYRHLFNHDVANGSRLPANKARIIRLDRQDERLTGGVQIYHLDAKQLDISWVFYKTALALYRAEQEARKVLPK